MLKTEIKMSKETIEKKYTGRGGYHGGGRKKLPAEEKKVYKNITISGTPEELELLKQKAKAAGKTTSRFVIESLDCVVDR